MNLDWKSFCEKITDSIWKAIKPIVGTDEASIRIKKYKKDTKKIDVIAEDIVIDQLKKEKMDVTLLSEEIGKLQIGSDPKYTIILDPIDGTTNSVRGLPFFSTSIAVAKGNTFEDLIFGYVKNYLTGEIFYVNQNGALYNDKECKSSTCTYLNKALISLYSYSNVNYNLIRKILSKIRKMRLFGAISIELMYVGCNILDGLVDLRGDLLLTDIAAGILFIKKVGGMVSRANGDQFIGKLDMNERYTVLAAGNEVLFNKFLKIIRA
ncbi:MAG: hypothetical protein HWN66_03565 [Candidatus Helarchaeota archaeon]|nr:hypothetical protein [Candidatus Helarchaeota archaeon]